MTAETPNKPAQSDQAIPEIPSERREESRKEEGERAQEEAAHDRETQKGYQ